MDNSINKIPLIASNSVVRLPYFSATCPYRIAVSNPVTGFSLQEATRRRFMDTRNSIKKYLPAYHITKLILCNGNFARGFINIVDNEG